MRRWGLLSLLLLAGCGGGGSSSVSQTFDIVGKWHVVQFSNDSGTTSCPGFVPDHHGCDDAQGFIFHEDKTYSNYVGGGSFAYEITPTVIFIRDTPYGYEHTVTTMTIHFTDYTWVLRKVQ